MIAVSMIGGMFVAFGMVVLGMPAGWAAPHWTRRERKARERRNSPPPGA